ncbi:MAG: cache domain-containing protein [Rhodospirillales bacterium]|nr:cache domain-containing protein [Rhodospirillales bacterium]
MTGRFSRRLFPILLVAAALGATAPAARATDEAQYTATEEEARHEIEDMVFRLRMFHEEARASLMASLALPVFAEYFALPESRANRYDSRGLLVLSERQTELRRRMEGWALALHRRFPIGETCLVDRQGQEHMRVVGGAVKEPAEFSSEENTAPFFAPTLALTPGRVHLSEPYMSPDVFRWVVAFATPLPPGADGKTPGFFHIEVPLALYQDILATKEYSFANAHAPMRDLDEQGRTFLIDRNGRLIADSRREIAFVKRPDQQGSGMGGHVHDERLADYLPPARSISAHPAFLAAIERMRQGETALIRLALDGKPYVLAFQPVPDRPGWSLGHLDPVGP